MRARLWLVAVVAATATATPLWAQAPTTAPPGARAAAAPQFETARSELRHLMEAHPGEPMPDNTADLDAALARDPGAVLKLLMSQKDPNQVYRDLNWERARIYGGAGFAVSMAYMLDLWRIAPAIPADPAKVNGDTPDGLRQTAVAFALYNIALVQLDGTRCADSSAPSHRIDQLAQAARPIFIYGRGMTADQKAVAVHVAIYVERATASVRTDDTVLCSGGLAEIQQGLTANGDTPLAPSSEPGVAGRTLSVPDAPGYKPAFLAADTWGPRQQKLRADLESEMTTLLTPPVTPGNSGK